MDDVLCPRTLLALSLCIFTAMPSNRESPSAPRPIPIPSDGDQGLDDWRTAEQRFSSPSSRASPRLRLSVSPTTQGPSVSSNTWTTQDGLPRQEDPRFNGRPGSFSRSRQPDEGLPLLSSPPRPSGSAGRAPLFAQESSHFRRSRSLTRRNQISSLMNSTADSSPRNPPLPSSLRDDTGGGNRGDYSASGAPAKSTTEALASSSSLHQIISRILSPLSRSESTSAPSREAPRSDNDHMLDETAEFELKDNAIKTVLQEYKKDLIKSGLESEGEPREDLDAFSKMCNDWSPPVTGRQAFLVMQQELLALKLDDANKKKAYYDLKRAGFGNSTAAPTAGSVGRREREDQVSLARRVWNSTKRDKWVLDYKLRISLSWLIYHYSRHPQGIHGVPNRPDINMTMQFHVDILNDLMSWIVSAELTSGPQADAIREKYKRAQAEGLPSLPSEEVRDSSALNRDKHKRRYWRKMVTIIKGVIVGELDSELPIPSTNTRRSESQSRPPSYTSQDENDWSHYDEGVVGTMEMEGGKKRVYTPLARTSHVSWA